MTNISETAVQQRVRLKASKRGSRLWRNNVGALMDTRGVPVRYGLCNESKAINKKLKSSDLIGITPVVITPEMVGQTLGVFTSYETKREGWKWSGSPREVAQLAWLNLIISLGGKAGFINSDDQM